ncbi:hypothetical protein [Mycobacterium avium]|uniref:hypothetical protein n=1 Tax=Mycobacterium avium TaxID=1764 RepID=UPI0039BE46CC
MLPIPGTSTVAHLAENGAARRIPLSHEDVRALRPAGPHAHGASAPAPPPPRASG